MALTNYLLHLFVLISSSQEKAAKPDYADPLYTKINKLTLW